MSLVIKESFLNNKCIVYRNWYNINKQQWNFLLNLPYDTISSRSVCYFGEKPYSYTGYSHSKKSIPKNLQSLINKINLICNFEFNSILINLYKNGNDYVGYHSDDEKELDFSVIASLSFGETRNFLIKNKYTDYLTKLELNNNDLLIMNDMQIGYKHSIPKQKNKKKRINLTFRKVL